MSQGLPERARIHDGEPVSRRLLASWQRSQEYGVPLETIEPTFSGTQDSASLFAECGREVLAGLQRTLATEPVSLMLTDPDGLVLNRFCGDPALLRALDDVHLAPGFAYAERVVGTNGLGLALADRAPTVVRADEHYALSLCTYTCAAAPVLDPATGRLEGCVNLTTWSRSSSELLLALAQSAAGTTAALMLARSGGHRLRPAGGEVVRLDPRLEPGAGTLGSLGAAWGLAAQQARAAFAAGQVLLATGEAGAGRSTLVAQALRHQHPRHRILAASPPAAQDTQAWLDLWTPELGKPYTAVLVRDVDLLPMWAAERLRELVTGQSGPFAVTAADYDEVPAPLAAVVDAVVAVPPLRERPDDVVPLALHAAQQARGRPIELTSTAQTALRGYGWPGNTRELQQVVRRAATRADVIDVRNLPPHVLAGGGHRLTRIETFERDEIVRVLSRPGISVRQAAQELGMSRATVYRKLAQYDIRLPRGS